MPKKSAAPKFVEKLLDVEIIAGKKAVIDCVVEGEPEPDIKWTFEGQPLKESDRIKFFFDKDDVVGLEIKKCHCG